MQPVRLSQENLWKRLERYFMRQDSHPRLVNVNSPQGVRALREHFCVGENQFKTVADFSRTDENLSEDRLFAFLEHAQGIVFLTGFSSFYRLLGEDALEQFLRKMASLSLCQAQLVVVCYQCEHILQNIMQEDLRTRDHIYLCEDIAITLPRLVFLSTRISTLGMGVDVHGIHMLPEAVETCTSERIAVFTQQRKRSYPASVYAIQAVEDAYAALCSLDKMVAELSAEDGSDAQWEQLLAGVQAEHSLRNYFSKRLGDLPHIDRLIVMWLHWDDEQRWLYFLALKLAGHHDTWCIQDAVRDLHDHRKLVRGIYRSLLALSPEQQDFWDCYEERKRVLLDLGHPEGEAADFCNMVDSKQEQALCYLTDATEAEREKIYQLMDRFADQYPPDRLAEILQHVCPDLAVYFSPYHFREPLLSTYFQRYKYQKLVNRIQPEFMNDVEEQAVKREYNRILPPRCEVVDRIPTKGTAVFFVDAMGAEYLSFLLDGCCKRQLMVDVAVCRAELPSLTCFNKEFLSYFEEGDALIYDGIKTLDDIKHHGNRYDFTKNPLPSYLTEELSILDNVLDFAAKHLKNGDCERAVILSDHGASRLCVLARHENTWTMKDTRGMHSGRCCPVSDLDEKPECATEENGFWVLANYDRFRGGRAANVEVHGGASLEEVVVPVLTLTLSSSQMEVILQTSEIVFRKRKRDAKIRIFSKTKLKNLNVYVHELEKRYDGETMDGKSFEIAIPELRKSGMYHLDIYTGDNRLDENIAFQATNKEFQENDIL